MSDTPQGPGWWQASDDKWYPPELAPPPPAPPPPPPHSPGASSPRESSPGGQPRTAQASGPPLKAPSKKALAITGAVLAVLVTIGAVVAFLTRTITIDVQGQGPVDEEVLMELISTGETEMDETAGADGANLYIDAHCFLSKQDESAAAVQSFLRCGPVLFVDAPDEKAAWMTMAFSADTEGERTREVTDRAIGDSGATIISVHHNDTLERGEHLFRPDGMKPSEESLEFPDPPAPDPDDPSAGAGSAATVPTDYAQVTDRDIGVELEPVDEQIIGLGFTMDLEGWATEKRITEGESVTVAPKGHELLVVAYSWDTTESYGYSNPSFAISVDGTSRSVDLPSGTGTLVAAVPEDAEDLGINAAEDTLDQTLSLSTGERSGDTPAIIYRDPASRSVSVNSTIQMPMTDVCLNDGCGPSEGLQTQLVLGRAELVWTQSLSDLAGYDASDAAPSDTDSAFLVLEVTNYDVVGPSVSYRVNNPQLNAEMITLSADGETYKAQSGTSLPGYIAFEVPAEITEATLTIAPGDNVQEISSQDRVFNFGQTTGEATISFPAG